MEIFEIITDCLVYNFFFIFYPFFGVCAHAHVLMLVLVEMDLIFAQRLNLWICVVHLYCLSSLIVNCYNFILWPSFIILFFLFPFTVLTKSADAQKMEVCSYGLFCIFYTISCFPCVVNLILVHFLTCIVVSSMNCENFMSIPLWLHTLDAMIV